MLLHSIRAGPMLPFLSKSSIRVIASLCLAILLPIHFLLAQQVFKGRIIDPANKKGIAYARVFIPHTEIGALTDEMGSFVLEHVPSGSFEILAHKVGYETLQKNVSCQEPKSCVNLTLRLQAKTKSIALKDVNISAKKSRAWHKRFRQFRKGFLGSSKQANKCEILNPDVLDLQESPSGELVVKARDLLEIKNPNTGYQLSFALTHFTAKGTSISYAGKPYFQKLNSTSAKEIQSWEERRAKTYAGSVRHFIKSLTEDRLEEEGFSIYQASLNATKSGFVQGKELRTKDILSKNEGKNTWTLSLSQFLQVVYSREVDNRPLAAPSVGGLNQQMGRSGEKAYMEKDFDPAGSHGRNQVSYLYILKAEIEIGPHGVWEKPEWVKEYGYWAWEKVAELLPLEYVPKGVQAAPKPLQENPQVKHNFPERNGFVLQNLKIPQAEIKSGGPPKDGIPAIDRPRFIQISQVDFLKDTDQIMSVSYQGITRAYPLKIMDRHEIVNDEFAGKAVSISYCPLCGSGLSFLGEVGGRKKTFGVSGLLYNSDVLLYDRETESLWSQIMSAAISGEESGAQLSFVPTQIMTWGAWKARFPQAEVLSTQTGFYKSYEESAYTDYRASQGLMFPVSHQSSQLPLKSWVLGIRIKGKSKAYPFSELAKSPGKIEDMIEGIRIIIRFEKDTRTTQVDLEGIPDSEAKVLNLYWFAWYAFHPETTIFRWKKHRK